MWIPRVWKEDIWSSGKAALAEGPNDISRHGMFVTRHMAISCSLLSGASVQLPEGLMGNTTTTHGN